MGKDYENIYRVLTFTSPASHEKIPSPPGYDEGDRLDAVSQLSGDVNVRTYAIANIYRLLSGSDGILKENSAIVKRVIEDIYSINHERYGHLGIRDILKTASKEIYGIEIYDNQTLPHRVREELTGLSWMLNGSYTFDNDDINHANTFHGFLSLIEQRVRISND